MGILRLDCSLIVKNFVDRLAVRDDVLCHRNFHNGVASHLCELFEKFDPHYPRTHSGRKYCSAICENGARVLRAYYRRR